MYSKCRNYFRFFLTTVLCLFPGILFANCDVDGKYLGGYRIAFMEIQEFNSVANTFSNVFETNTFGTGDYSDLDTIRDSCPYEVRSPIIINAEYKYRDKDKKHPIPIDINLAVIDSGANHLLEGTVIDQGSLNLFSNAMCLIQATVTNSMFKVYCRVLHEMTPIVKMLIVLYIMFYGISIVIGSQKGQLVKGQNSVIPRIILIMLVYELTTNADAVYFWIFSNFFGFLNSFATLILEVIPAYENTIVVQTDGSSLLVKKKITEIYPNINLFQIIDHIFEAMVGSNFMVTMVSVIMALMIGSGGVAFPLAIFLFGVLWAMIKTFLFVFVNYITAVITLTFSLMFTPLFIVLALFEPTKEVFKNWVSSILNSTMQAGMVLIFIFVMAQAQNLEPVINYVQNSAHLNKDGTYVITVLFKKFNFEGYWKLENAKPGITAGDCALPEAFANYDDDPATCWVICDDDANLKDFNDTVTAGDCRAPNIGQLLAMMAAFGVAMLMLASVSSAFLVKLPELSKHITTWNYHKSLPIITGASKTAAQVTGDSDGAQSHNEQTVAASGTFGPGGILQAVGTRVQPTAASAAEAFVNQLAGQTPSRNRGNTMRRGLSSNLGSTTAGLSGMAAGLDGGGPDGGGGGPTTRRSGGGGGNIAGATTRRGEASSINAGSTGLTRRRADHNQSINDDLAMRNHSLESMRSESEAAKRRADALQEERQGRRGSTTASTSKSGRSMSEDYEAMFNEAGESASQLRSDGYSNAEIRSILAGRMKPNKDDNDIS